MNERPVRKKEILIAALLLLLLLLFQTRPLYRQIASSVIYNPGIYLNKHSPNAFLQWKNITEWDYDISIAVWAHHWFIHALGHKPSALFDANIYYPYPNSMAFMDCYLGQAIIGLPIAKIFDLPALTYNWILLSHLLLTGLAVFLYVRYKTGLFHAGFITGAAALLLPYHYVRMATIHKSAFFSLPLSLFLIDRYLITRRLRYAFGLALVLAFQIISTWYLTVILFFLIGFYCLHLLLCCRRLLLRRDTLKGVIILLLIVTPVLLFTMTPYLKHNKAFPQFERKLGAPLSVSPKTYLTVPRQNLLYGDILFDKSFKRLSKSGYFPGFVLYVLAACGIVITFIPKKWQRKDHTRTELYLLLTLLPAILLSLGPYFTMANKEWKLPYYYLVQIVPLMKGLRGPQDFVLIFYTAILFFTGVAIAFFIRNKNQTLKNIVTITIFLLIVIETQNKPFSIMPLPNRNQVAECFSKPIPGAKAVATFYPYRDKHNTIQYVTNRPLAMYCSIFHMLPIPEGHTAYSPPLGQIYEKQVDNFPHFQSLDYLKALGISHVFIDCRLYGTVTPHEVESHLSRRPNFRNFDVLTDSLVIELTPPEKKLLKPIVAFFETANRQVRLGFHNPGRTILLLYPKDRELRIVDKAAHLETNNITLELPYVIPSSGLLEFTLSQTLQKHIIQYQPESIDIHSTKSIDFHADLLSFDQWCKIRNWLSTH